MYVCMYVFMYVCMYVVYVTCVGGIDFLISSSAVDHVLFQPPFASLRLRELPRGLCVWVVQVGDGDERWCTQVEDCVRLCKQL